jgi:hypothetical protein
MMGIFMIGLLVLARMNPSSASLVGLRMVNFTETVCPLAIDCWNRIVMILLKIEHKSIDFPLR